MVAYYLMLISLIFFSYYYYYYYYYYYLYSVCLILELCSFGSLSDIIRGYGFDWNSANQRAPLKLAYTDVLYLALGCAR